MFSPYPSLPPQMSCATSRRSSRPSARSSTRPSPRCPATKDQPTTNVLLPVRVSLSPSHLYASSSEEERKSLLFHTSFNTVTIFHCMTSMVTWTLRWDATVPYAEQFSFFARSLRAKCPSLSHTISQIILSSRGYHKLT